MNTNTARRVYFFHVHGHRSQEIRDGNDVKRGLKKANIVAFTGVEAISEARALVDPENLYSDDSQWEIVEASQLAPKRTDGDDAEKWSTHLSATAGQAE